MKASRIMAGTIALPAFLFSIYAAEIPPKPPLGLPPVTWPKSNPYSVAKVELGRYLYFDKRLSIDGTVSCASCHDPKYGFTDGAAVSTGIKTQKGGRSAPSLIVILLFTSRVMTSSETACSFTRLVNC